MTSQDDTGSRRVLVKDLESRNRETDCPLQQARLEHQEDTEKAERLEESHKDDCRIMKIRKTCFRERSQRPPN